jgi:ribonuclease P protein component
VFQHGRHNSAKLMAVRSVSNAGPLTRFGYAIPKRVGNAVVRNKIRRRLREILRRLPFREGYDVVITVRPDAATASFHTLLTELTLLLHRARVLDEGPSPRPGAPA